MKRKLNGSIKSNLSIITKRILIIFIIFTLFFTVSSSVLLFSSGAPEEGSKNYLLVSSGNSLYKVSEDGKEIKRMGTGMNGDIEWGLFLSPDGKKILFGFNQSIEFGNYHESWWIMNSDGTGKKDLGIEIGIKDGSAYLPFFSPDGKRILFQPKLSRFFKRGAWMMNTDGTRKINLSEEMKGGDIAYSSFSPDGKKILLELVESVSKPVNTEYLFAWIMNSDGTGKKAITKNLIGSVAGYSFKGLPPSFSPDGKKILLGLHFQDPKYTKEGAPLLSYTTSIWLMDTEGTGEELVRDKKGPLGCLSFSADGKKVLFAFEDGKFPRSYPSIWIMNSDGTEKRNITGEMKGELWDVSLSLDGKKILFGFNSEVWTMNPDGTEKRKLAEGGDRGLSFSADGKKIAFFGLYGRSFWVMNSDGTKKINLNETLGIQINNAIWYPKFKDTTISNVQELFAQIEQEEKYFIALECIDPSTDDEVEKTIKIIKKRLDLLGFSESIIKRCGFGHILIELSNMNLESYKIISFIETPGLLEFKDETGKTLLSGKHITFAEVIFDSFGRPTVSIEFNKIGAEEFGIVTQKNVGKKLVITLDDKEISSPVVQETIFNGKAIITGRFTVESANRLTILLKSGALPVQVKIL